MPSLRPIRVAAAALFLLLAWVAPPAPAAPPAGRRSPAGRRFAAPPTPAPPAPPGFADLAARVLPAVVNIAASTAATPTRPSRAAGGAAFDRLFRNFMRGDHAAAIPPPHGGKAWAGFIVDPAGLIVTNNHVIAGAHRIAVTLQDGTVLAAKVVGRDRSGDLALLVVHAGHPLPALRWGDSAAAQVGDWVLAIGNPFGLGGSVTAGIISARGRDIHDGPYDDFIQTDAPINRGNSGGPLFDLAGRVIGVTTAIYSPSGGSIGIGFAIPSDIARIEIAQLRRYGRPRHGWLGLQAEPVTAAIARVLGLKRAVGALVAAVAPDGPAAAAGLRRGDVILRFAGDRLRPSTLPRRVAEAAPGSIIPLLIWRDGQRLTVSARLGATPARPTTRSAPGAPGR